MKVKKLRPPFKIHGGKYYLCQWIISYFPAGYENMTYLEPFGGAGSVLLNKRRSIREIYNDIHNPTANVFLSLVHEPDEMVQKIHKIEYSEKFFHEAMETEFNYGTVSSALAELVLRRMSRGGMKKHFSWSTRTRGGRPGDVNAWETFKSQLPLICDRLQKVEVFSKDAMSLIENNLEDKMLLLYLDPPYALGSRTAKKVYDYEMEDEDHRRLAILAQKVVGRVLISGYDCPLYKKLYSGWRCVTKEMPNNSGQGNRKQRRLECLWVNY
jgi:DNA adenine methylase